MASIEETIDNVEKLYTAVTGRPAPPADAVYAPIPAERDPLEHVEEQLTKLVATLETADRVMAAGPAFTPPLLAWETESELVLCFDVPGVKREDVDVGLQKNVLTVAGRRERFAGPASVRVVEIPAGPFRRSVVLPFSVKGKEPQAQVRDGVLEVRIAKEPPEKARPIRVN